MFGITLIVLIEIYDGQKSMIGSTDSYARTPLKMNINTYGQSVGSKNEKQCVILFSELTRCHPFQVYIYVFMIISF